GIALGADRQAVRGVLDVTPREDPAAFGQYRRTDAEVAVRAVRPRSRLSGGFREIDTQRLGNRHGDPLPSRGDRLRARNGWMAHTSTAPTRYEPDAPASEFPWESAMRSLALRARRRHSSVRSSSRRGRAPRRRTGPVPPPPGDRRNRRTTRPGDAP